jgi:hypothetical protein
MTYDLSEQARSDLTEKVLGECWHNFTDNFKQMECIHCGKFILSVSNRTFSTPQDAHDLAKKLVEMRKWGEFMDYGSCIWADDFNSDGDEYDDFVAWLFAEPISPKRFAWLVWTSRVWEK